MLDVDNKPGSDDNGFDSLKDFPALPPTFTVDTPNYGRHYYFIADDPASLTIGGGFAPGLDFRAGGRGYVVGAGSTIDGKMYTVSSYSPMADAPDWLEEVARKSPSFKLAVDKTAVEKVTLVQIEKTLSTLDPDVGYDVWNKAAMAIHSEYPGRDGFELFDRWSSKGKKYKPRECEKHWNSFSDSGGITIGTLFHLAKQHGKSPSGSASEPLLIESSPPLGPKAAVTASVRTGFRLVGMPALAQQPAALPMAIRGIMPSCGIGTIIGPSYSCKTFVAIDMGLSVATGRPWCEHDVEQGLVVIIAGEGHSGISRRMKGWSIQTGIDHSSAPIFVSECAADLTSQKGFEAVNRAIDHASGEDSPALIIIDTLNRNIGDCDENSASEMRRYIEAVDLLAKRYDCFVLTVHHTGKDKSAGARGSSALYAAMDVQYDISKTGSNVMMECKKMKDFVEPDPHQFELRPVVLPWYDYYGDPIQSAALTFTGNGAPAPTLSKAEELALSALCEAIEAEGTDGTVDKKAWIAAFKEKHSGRPDTARKALNRSIEVLIDTGVIFEVDDRFGINQPSDPPKQDNETGRDKGKKVPRFIVR